MGLKAGMYAKLFYSNFPYGMGGNFHKDITAYIEDIEESSIFIIKEINRNLVKLKYLNGNTVQWKYSDGINDIATFTMEQIIPLSTLDLAKLRIKNES